MYEDEINNLVQRCRNLKNNFRGVFAANNFPLPLNENQFIIINASNENSAGTHWLLIYKYKNIYIFADPLGYPLAFYKYVNHTLCHSRHVSTIVEILKMKPIQKPNSKSCGLFCIYVAHMLQSSQYDLNSTIHLISENELARFMKHMLL